MWYLPRRSRGTGVELVGGKKPDALKVVIFTGLAGRRDLQALVFFCVAIFAFNSRFGR